MRSEDSGSVAAAMLPVQPRSPSRSCGGGEWNEDGTAWLQLVIACCRLPLALIAAAGRLVDLRASASPPVALHRRRSLHPIFCCCCRHPLARPVVSSSAPLIPDFKWAENNDNIFLTVEVSDAKDLKVDIKDDQIVFAANSQGKDYALDLKLKKKIDAAVRRSRRMRERSRAAGSASLKFCGRLLILNSALLLFVCE